MSSPSLPVGAQVIVEPAGLEHMVNALAKEGYHVLGPTVREGAIVYGPLKSAADLPVGWTDLQESSKYRLVPRGDSAIFGYTTSPQSWKRFLHPPAVRLWEATTDEGMLNVTLDEDQPEKLAFVGVRACDLQAIMALDRVLLQGSYTEPRYRALRENMLVVAVNCTQAGGTCFCASTHTGPRAESGFDLALTEVCQEGRHYMLAQVGSERGAALLAQIPYAEASEEDKTLAASLVARAAEHMGRTLDVTGLKEVLYRNYENPLWEEVAARCLTCANCTLVCPTCFCTTVEDSTNLAGTRAERWRKWDSCFTLDFSYIHGGSIRTSPMSRYRQWMTHKFAAYADQFGVPGCVGCGRCITWCPAGIDPTEQAQAIRDSEFRRANLILAEQRAGGLP